MRNAVSISLPDDLLKKVRRQSKRESANFSELIRRALNEYFFTTEFKRLRQKALAELEKKGISLTDEEIFKKVS